jgi:hypothetical protein
VEDIGEIIQAQPEILIIGCGASGMLKIPVETKNYIQEQGIQLIAEETKKACEMYNHLCPKKRLIASLHLTC